MNLLQTVRLTLESKKSLKIAFIGDSITSAEWIHPNWREIVEYVLKQEFEKQFADWKTSSWGIRCFNYGFDGSTTADIKRLIENGTIPTDFDLAIYQLGDNDQYEKIPSAQYQANVNEVLSKFTSEIILCSNSAANNTTINANYEKTYYPCFTQLSSHPKTIGVDLFAELQKLDLSNLYTLVNKPGNDVASIKPGAIDFLHPNQLGNAYIAKVILGQAFQISFSPEKYLRDCQSDLMYPEY